MHVTDGEIKAAHQLADALVHFIAAVQEGARARRAKHPKDELNVRVEYPAPPAPPKPPAVADQPAEIGRKTPERLLVTMREAARLLSISDRKLWAMTASHDCPLRPIRIGRAVRFAIEDLARFVADGKRTRR